MKFYEQLNAYLQLAGVSQKELAKSSGLSEATISRFCSGKREPAYNSEEIDDLARALATYMKKNHGASTDSGGSAEDISEGDVKDNSADALSYAQIRDTLRNSVEDMLRVDYDVFLENLNYLLKYLGVKNTDLAKGIHSDLSHVSRILTGNSNPGNASAFIYDVSSYLALRYSDSSELPAIAKIIDVDVSEISSTAALQKELAHYLGSNSNIESDDSFPHFLSKLDEFDLNDYLKAVRFDEIKLPPSLPQRKVRKEYYGIKEFMDSELDFMKSTVLSKSTDDCIMYSDMPIEEMAADPEFPKKYMFGLAMMLKKGLHIHQIHDVNRPFPEMMIGLENWIPLYMTGQISPYYLPISQSQVFLHFLKVSGAAALEGTAIAGSHDSGRYVLFRSKADVAHYRTRAKQLLSKALPLMDIYRKDGAKLFRAVAQTAFSENDCKIICSNLPVYCVPEDLLEKILDRAKTDTKTRDIITAYSREFREMLAAQSEKLSMHLVVPAPNRERFENEAPGLALADLFLDEEIALTYEEYTACLEGLRELEKKHENLRLEIDPAAAFHNINITIFGEKTVIVSKEKSPNIHFVIHHKKMIRAFRNFIPPIADR